MKVLDQRESKTTFSLAIVVSRFNESITKRLLEGAVKRTQELGFGENQVTVAWVPGAVEIPIAAQRLAQLGIHDAIVALGAVIRGETDHYDYVCRQVSEGCQHVALQNDIPVAFGVLTVDNEDQALARIGGKHGHKGADAVDCAAEMVALLRQIG